MFGRLSQHSTRALSGVSSSSSSLVSPPPFLSSSLGGKGERFLSNQGGVPDKARVVVIGGGIIGNSVAYHLAKMGWGKDVVLLERDQLTSGTTWHAAGLMVRFGSTSHTSTDFRKYSHHLYSTQLEEETGQSTGFRPCGFIEIATEKNRLEEYRRIAAFNRAAGVDVHEIGPSEIKKLFPLCKTDDILSGFYVEDDGRVNPVDAAMAFSKGAKMNGAKIISDVLVEDVITENGEVKGVKTTKGDVKCEYVINCGGMWARQFSEKYGVHVPNQAAEHYYLVTEPMAEVDPDWPVIEDPANFTYIRPEAGGLMVGLFEGKGAAWNPKQIPNDFSFGEISPDWERMAPYLEAAMGRVPATNDVGAKTFFCGPESFTPDNLPILGPSPQLKNYFVAAGMNSIGILTGGGVGRLMAHWIINGKPDMDVCGFHVNRFRPHQMNRDYRQDRCEEALGLTYKCHLPDFSHESGRGVRKTPIHDRLQKKGAYFKEVSGWESPAWYSDVENPDPGNLTWGKPVWFENWKEEHEACRNNAALFDMSFMSKFLVQGKTAGKFLNYLATSNVQEKGKVHYTQFLDEDGTMRADVTIMQLSEESYLVVATDTMEGQVKDWLNSHITENDHVFVHDVTNQYAQINIQGPQSREVMQQISHDDFSTSEFPYLSFKEIEIGYARAYCGRISYVGELGYELFIPVDQTLHVFDRIMEKENVGLKLAGLKSLGSLRLEKGYRDFGHDMDNLDTLNEVGLSFTADMKKEGGFLGKEAILKQKANEKPLKKRLCNILLKEDQGAFLHHAEVITRDGVHVGEIRAGSYGHTLGGGVGLAMIENKEGVSPSFLNSGKWEINVGGLVMPVEVSLKPFFDPTGERMKV